jgi:chromosome segregation ATPase
MSALYRLQALQSDAMTHLTGLAQTTKITLDNREDFVVDLSSELVEKDLQVEQMSNRIQALEQQVEIRDNTIEVLENQLHDVKEELEKANAHIEMHHQDMDDLEAGSEEEEDPELLVWTRPTSEYPLHLWIMLPLLLRVRWVIIKHVGEWKDHIGLAFGTNF